MTSYKLYKLDNTGIIFHLKLEVINPFSRRRGNGKQYPVLGESIYNAMVFTTRVVEVINKTTYIGKV